MLLGIAEATAGNLAEAAAAFDAAEADQLRAEEASRWRRKFWVETFNVGLAALNDDSLGEAESSFKQATVLDPTGAMAYRNLGIVHERQERVEEAAAAYEMAVNIDSSDASTALQLGYLHYQNEDWERTIEWIAPRAGTAQDAGYYRVLASAYDHLEMEDKALAALQAALEIEPEDSELLSDIAGIFLRRDDYQTAVGYLERASALAPDDTVVGYNYAVSLIRVEDETTALSILEGLVAGDDSFADGWELLSQLYLRADRIKEGQEAYDKSEKLRVEQ
jgi:Flp pilus assembly protein TadD